MYRARVESVSGLQVRAGGKWLNCIGNRAFKVGDLIWTDGRCVYGNDRETQAPLVIANPVKEDSAIPIQIVDNSAETLFNYRKDNLIQVFSGKNTGRLLNDTKGHSFYLNAAAANIDKAGNIYILDGNDAGYEYNAVNNSSPEPNDFPHTYGRVGSPVICNNQNPRLAIQKNGRIVKEIALADLIENAADIAQNNSSAWIDTPEPFVFSEPNGEGSTHGDATFAVYEDTRSARLLYAFIENENSWAAVYKISATYEYWIYWWAWGEGYYPGTPQNWYGIAASDVLRFYYIDSSGEKKILYQVDSVWNRKDYDFDLSVRPEFKGVDDTRVAVSNTDAIKIPMQDGYYFKVNYSLATLYILPTTYRFYSPGGEHLCDLNDPYGEEINSTWAFTIYRIATGKYFLGVGRTQKAWWEPTLHGLYICEGGELTRLADGHCLNYFLRPMKKYKRWWERIQILE